MGVLISSMSSSEKMATTTPGSILNPSLPDDLTLSCIARLSRLYYPTLSLVSKRFPYLLTSPELYKSRSLLNRTESCLYVCLCIHSDDQEPRWFTLCRKPNNEKNLLIPIRAIQSPPHSWWSEFVAVGSNIYSIFSTNRVTILDCRSNTWHEAPKRRFGRFNPSSACVVDEKIYVLGGRVSKDEQVSIEVFDTKTQIWDLVPCPKMKTNRYTSVCFDGKLHLLSDGGLGFAYDPKEGKWDLVEQEMMDDKDWRNVSYCVIENVLYCYDNEELLWYDTKLRSWKNVKGLVGLLPVFPNNLRPKFVDYGGKMMVLWVEQLFVEGDNKTTILCAEIVIERREGDELWGGILWIDNAFTYSGEGSLIEVLVVTL